MLVGIKPSYEARTIVEDFRKEKEKNFISSLVCFHARRKMLLILCITPLHHDGGFCAEVIEKTAAGKEGEFPDLLPIACRVVCGERD